MANVKKAISVMFLAVTFGSGAVLAQSAGLPRPDHVVIVFEEDKSFKQIIGNAKAPFINGLAAQGALLTNSFGIRHPSLPNYIAFFSGSTHRVRNNKCSNGPRFATEPNLGSELIAKGFTFGGYAESLPFVGYAGCATGNYVRKHNPWVRFTNIPPENNMPFANFPQDFAQLPTLSIVVPNELNNMHDGSIAKADAWLSENLGPYIEWAKTHNSLFILTFDEGAGRGNHIPTIFVGPMVRPGQYDQRVNHYNVLRTLLDMYGLTPMANAVEAEPITNVWQPVPAVLAPRADEVESDF